MEVQGIAVVKRTTPSSKLWQDVKRGFPLYLMITPGLLFFILFKYLPMGGIIIAFKQYDPFVGFMDSPWVGFDHFVKLFTEPDFFILLRNTMLVSLFNLIFFFPAPVVLALLLHEVKVRWFRKTMQTIVYMPHFFSWVVVVGITVLLFATQSGGINNLLASLGLERVELLTNPDYFRSVYVFQNIWKEAGWNAIIFLAALAAVDPTLYEAARVDGAGRWRQMWSINVPALKSTIIILFILRLGSVLEVGFEHIYLMQNSINIGVSDVFDSYVYRNGVLQGAFSYTTAVGLFKSLVGLVLVIGANRLSKKLGEEGVY
ncbi:ABC transporter permease [Paenibacillus qinlingensis]|uniref:ABC transporter permease n=1 Tax=Paenibacillus qinlingensis TaxID=1837343 RepID=UPI00156692C7|nr:ABC transporter permease subunit [Paenibacillus qinlingensis]NQX62768.1 sugar ABC transporter permease [Paenibacillus qinlingensis]